MQRKGDEHAIMGRSRYRGADMGLSFLWAATEQLGDHDQMTTAGATPPTLERASPTPDWLSWKKDTTFARRLVMPSDSARLGEADRVNYQLLGL